MKYLVTGAAGFIGFHTAESLLQDGHEVVGYDSVNDYYDPWFKEIRLKRLREFPKFKFEQGFVEDRDAFEKVWAEAEPEAVLHLAAQAGVRYSIEHPEAYLNANLIGFHNVIELARKYKPGNLVYASSSSVYGGNKELPFSESQDVSQPISLYAATKASNELVAKAYSHLYEIPTTGLRFFTVYGTYGRPDMALFIFTRCMLVGEELPVFNRGNMYRDFTYIDDIVAGVRLALDKPQHGAIYNLGRGRMEVLREYIDLIARELGVEPKLNLMPMQLGDVPATHADILKAQNELGYNPTTDIAVGVPRFVQWYQDYAHCRI